MSTGTLWDCVSLATRGCIGCNSAYLLGWRRGEYGREGTRVTNMFVCVQAAATATTTARRRRRRRARRARRPTRRGCSPPSPPRRPSGAATTTSTTRGYARTLTLKLVVRHKEDEIISFITYWMPRFKLFSTLVIFVVWSFFYQYFWFCLDIWPQFIFCKSPTTFGTR